jgi:hypothetical protein
MANLGRMDKGIDDCDNAIEEIYAKRVNNVVTTNEDTFLAGPVGKVLQDQVTELNKNLVVQSGEWTPSFAGSTGDGDMVQSNGGSYYKIGRLVVAEGHLTITSVTASPTGYAVIDGLPFVSTIQRSYDSRFSGFVFDSNKIVFDKQLSLLIEPGGTRVQIKHVDANNLVKNITADKLIPDASLRVVLIYLAA